ncbi:hypothetical protein F5Y10DRAFT_283165 [Nemania abortiva]|nr:hypothetical protein F5Y10DRAFT_283165 [Nemania abortiva]
MGDTSDKWKRQEREIINKFFREKVPEALRFGVGSASFCTEDSCIQFAKTAFNTDDVVAVDNQGSNSFTLSSPVRGIVIQFRLKPLPTDTVRLANEIYGNQPKPNAETSWTKSAEATFRRLTENASLKNIAPEFSDLVSNLQQQLHLLEILPAVLTHHDFASVNILVGDSGHVNGVIDFDSAEVEAFGMCIWGLYECFFGSMEDGKWSFYDMPADGGDTSGRTVREVLEETFWESLWAHTPSDLKREDTKRAVKVWLFE